MKDKQIGGGLIAALEDERDFSFGSVYGLPELSDLPSKYKTSDPLKIKDQGDTDLCTAFAITSVSEDQEQTTLSPEYQFAMTKQIIGKPDGWGADLRSACKAIVKFGSLPDFRVPDDLKLNGNRDKIADWTNWPKGIGLYAKTHRKKSYFKIPSHMLPFDAMRAVLWQTRKEERSIFTGASWQTQWTTANGGYVNDADGVPSYGHAFKIFGWENEYLLAHLSNGTEVGDHGLFYFHRNAVNKVFTFSGYTLQDIDPEKAKWHIEKRITINESWLKSKFISFIR